MSIYLESSAEHHDRPWRDCGKTDGGWRARAACPTLVLTASIDHPVLDGVAGAKFLRRMKECRRVSAAFTTRLFITAVRDVHSGRP